MTIRQLADGHFFNVSKVKEQPIGIFDSGVGGLTVAHAIKQLLPGESLIYFGDTAHLPYGDKSAEAIKYYSGKITEFLLDRGSKVILVACNSASSSALDIGLSISNLVLHLGHLYS